MMRRHALSLAVIALAAAGCSGNSTGGMNVPVVWTPPLQTLSAARPVSDTGGGWKSVRLERVIVDLPRGTVIAHFPHRFWKKWKYLDLCNLGDGPDATVVWGRGIGYFGDWSTEVGSVFFDVLQRRGMNVVGDASALFNTREKMQGAEFLIGGRITDIRGNMCHRHQPLTSLPLNHYLGEFYVRVEWEVFSTLAGRVVHEFETEGYAETTTSMREGIFVTFLKAFEAAVINASHNKGLIRTLAPGGETQVVNASHDPLTIVGRSRYRDSIRNRLGEVTEAAVTIELGGGHGSGFLVSHDGYLLTNAHVVGEAERVPVVFRNGLRVNGIVLRRARYRDVALVKIPIVAPHILPIRLQARPAVGDDVWVIGSPFDPALRSTVTKGIVSAYRNLGGNIYIQADAAVTGGNSGGPLVDDHGNVIGITVAKVPEAENLNLFIPIDEALQALDVNVTLD